MSFYLPATSKIESTETPLRAYQEVDISVKYRDISGLNSSSSIVTADKLRLDLSSAVSYTHLTLPTNREV